MLWSACLVVVLAMGITAIGTTVATGQTELHLVALASELKEKIVDVKGNGVGVGDMAVVRERLLDATGTDQVGTAYWHGVVVRSPSNEPLLWRWGAVFDLADGQLMIEGVDPTGPGEGPFSILGGTGVYANATGDGVWTVSAR